ncbi:member of major facilitator superfamily multidrug-resistance, DHA1 sub-family [Cyathus striatus]|nr:member of major facilitator superfamily multidrug-resistance, DHA1 sub-family [Cyathus striatus]
MDTDIHSRNAINEPRTALPIKQIFILLLLRFCESLATYSIYPFLLELLSSVTGGDKGRVGYYAGFMALSQHLLSIVTILYWSRLSDRIGRKPVLFIGTTAVGISMLCFGLAKTFLGLVLSRSIISAFGSNAGIIKGTFGEITDESNRADAFALVHIPWTVGAFIGPLIGGSLSNPHDHFHGVFRSAFWLKYPYFLPCAVVATISFIGTMPLLIYFKETVKGSKFFKPPEVESEAIGDEETMSLLSHSTSPSISDNPIPFKDLLQYSILLPAFKYAALSFLHGSNTAIQPLFLGLPIAMGGLDFNPETIGYVLGFYGASNAVVQIFLLGPIVRRMGAKNVYLMSISMFVFIFCLPPIMSMFAKQGGVNGLVWFLLALQLLCSVIMELGYGCTYILITEAAPNKRSLGSINGLAQTLSSISRISAPMISSSLLSFSIENNLFHGYAGYVSLACFTVACSLFFWRSR